ncbi:hypothetical protein [Legionella sp. 16cNR16C]|uniref:hypothetical protein n=1 Tax=Legionella sp. 16cNR16C TaxID=2905656 RepID=UPI001E5E2391|nr:hypothetical protein [Legionella sp. 16cNR16C]MCE3045430.1 hypothetical protein [Legionella sp. 16cNR16C]
MNSSRNMFVSGLFSSIGFIYFFILPVYIPIRALGIETHFYDKVARSPLELILYFLQITMLLACNSMLLSFFYQFLSKKLSNTGGKNPILHLYRSVAVVFSSFFVITSYFIMNPPNLLSLYAWSGAHYFVICYFQLLVRAEISNARKTNLSTAQVNNYFGIVLNISGVVALGIFSWFFSKGYAEQYRVYCIVLEIAFVCYLLLVRKYYLSFRVVTTQYSVIKILVGFLLIILTLVIASIVSTAYMLSGSIGALLILIFIAYFYKTHQIEIDKIDLQLIVSIGLGYGLVLAVLTGSILTYFVENEFRTLDVFNYAYSSEPFFSILIGLIFTLFLLKWNITFSRKRLMSSIFLLNLFVPVIFGIFFWSIDGRGVAFNLLVFIFAAYAFLEYLSLFYIRQIAQLEQYSELQGAKLTNFHSLVLNGLSPALLYLLIFCLSKFTLLELKQILIIAIVILTMFSTLRSLMHKYFNKI